MRPTVTSVINGKKMLVRVGIENIEPKGVGSRMGANHPAPFNAARRLAEGAGHSVELSAVTEVLYMKTYDPTQTALFGIGLGGDLIGLKARRNTKEPVFIRSRDTVEDCTELADGRFQDDMRPPRRVNQMTMPVMESSRYRVEDGSGLVSG